MGRHLDRASRGRHAPAAHGAAPCPGNADALGTARVLDVDAATTPRVGRKQFPQTLPLAPKEVVLTFDDGPWPGTTERVLDALRQECVRATFFLIGRNAPPVRRWRSASSPRATPSAITASRIRCSTACRSKPRRPTSIAASRRSMARCAARPAQGGAVLPLSLLLLHPAAPGLAGAPPHGGVRGRPVGERLEPDDARPGAAPRARARRGQPAAASCCFTTPRRRPPPCCRPSCAPSRRADSRSWR